MTSVSVMPVAAVMALCGVCLMYFGQWRAQRRLRSVLRVEMARIFEQIDMLRLDNLQLQPDDSPGSVASGSRARAALTPLAFNRPVTIPSGEAYAAALELAARGADQSELTARCGLGRDEARILVAMQGAAARRANAA
jgi:hypothetical protein